MSKYILCFSHCVQKKENVILERIYLTNFFHGERIVIDSLFLSGKILPFRKEDVFIIEGFPNHKEPVRFKIYNIQRVDSKLKIQLDPFQKNLGGGLFNEGDEDFFFRPDSSQEKRLKKYFLNNMNFYFDNDPCNKVSLSNRSSVYISKK